MIVFGVLHLWSEIPSVVVSTVIVTVPAYYLNRHWAWGKSGRSHLLKEVIPFWTTSFAGLLLASLAAGLAHAFSDAHNLRHFDRTIVV